jgi:hypothetical protein
MAMLETLSRSVPVTKPPPAPGGQPYQVYNGFYFDEREWDGSDIFLVHGFKVVTLPVRRALSRAGIGNVRLMPLAEVEIDAYLCKTN